MQKSNAAWGGALLTALFIMTMIAIVATAMSTRLQLDIYRTRLMIQQDNLYLASQAVTFWAVSELKDKENLFSRVNKQGMVAIFPQNMANLTLPIRASGALYDLQSVFNLNNLSDKKYYPMFMRLLDNIQTNLNPSQKAPLVLAIVDWVSNYDLGKGQDEYITYYMSQKPPYYPSHQLFYSKSELRLVKDINAEEFAAISPFVTALPETTTININTASKEVLQALAAGLNVNQVNELIQARGEEGITKMEDVNEILKKLNITTDLVTIESQYFLAVADLQIEDVNLRVYTLFKRAKDQKTQQLLVSILRESFNTF